MATRVIEHLLPVMRELGLVTTFTDVNFSSVRKPSTRRGVCWTRVSCRRVNKFLDELLWMARVLRHGRENIAPL